MIETMTIIDKGVELRLKVVDKEAFEAACRSLDCEDEEKDFRDVYHIIEQVQEMRDRERPYLKRDGLGLIDQWIFHLLDDELLADFTSGKIKSDYAAYAEQQEAEKVFDGECADDWDRSCEGMSPEWLEAAGPNPYRRQEAAKP